MRTDKFSRHFYKAMKLAIPTKLLNLLFDMRIVTREVYNETYALFTDEAYEFELFMYRSDSGFNRMPLPKPKKVIRPTGERK